jgi:hypothetical protein
MEAGVPVNRTCASVSILALAVLLPGITARAASASPEASEGDKPAGPTKDQCADANEAAQTLRAASKLRSAIDQLTVCVSKSCPAPVRDDCARRLDDAQKALPTVVFDVHTAAGADVTAVTVKMDETVLTTTLDGSAIAVDPGQHTFSFAADGLPAIDKPVLIREGVRAQHVRMILGGTVAPPVFVTAEPPRANHSSMRVASYVAFGVGVAGLAMTAVFGLLALGDRASLNNCAASGACPPSDRSALSGLHSNGELSDIGTGVGLAGLAVGTVLFILSRPKDSAAGDLRAKDAWIGFGRGGIEATF